MLLNTNQPVIIEGNTRYIESKNKKEITYILANISEDGSSGDLIYLKNYKAKEISKLVEQLLSLNAEKVNTKLQTKISQIESRAIYCMNKIDQIVYELFELTAAEIKIIETK